MWHHLAQVWYTVWLSKCQLDMNLNLASDLNRFCSLKGCGEVEHRYTILAFPDGTPEELCLSSIFKSTLLISMPCLEPGWQRWGEWNTFLAIHDQASATLPFQNCPGGKDESRGGQEAVCSRIQAR